MNDWMENANAVRYGADGLGIGSEYPVESFGTPTPASTATWSELGEAGWSHRGGTGPLIDGQVPVFFVLRNEASEIVATWDEGRWWTPRESAAFEATLANPAVRMMAEATASLSGNRAERRRRKQ